MTSGTRIRTPAAWSKLVLWASPLPIWRYSGHREKSIAGEIILDNEFMKGPREEKIMTILMVITRQTDGTSVLEEGPLL